MTWSGNTSRNECQPTRGDQGNYPPAGRVSEPTRRHLGGAVPELTIEDVVELPKPPEPDTLDNLVQSGRLQNN